MWQFCKRLRDSSQNYIYVFFSSSSWRTNTYRRGLLCENFCHHQKLNESYFRSINLTKASSSSTSHINWREDEKLEKKIKMRTPWNDENLKYRKMKNQFQEQKKNWNWKSKQNLAYYTQRSWFKFVFAKHEIKAFQNVICVGSFDKWSAELTH